MKILGIKLRRFSSDAAVDQTLRHSVKDGVAYSVMTGAGESYFSAFALFFKATSAQIAVLASVPPLLGSFVQLFSAWLGRHGRSRHNLIMFGASLQGLMLLPLIILPMVFPEQANTVVLIIVILYFAAVNIASPQWWSLMGDVVPEHRRGRYFALRTRMCSLTAFIAFLVAGLILHLFDSVHYTLWGFVSLFILAMIARFVSVYHISKMHDTPGHVAILESPFQKGLWRRIKGSNIARFSIFYASMQFAVAIASPFFVVYMLRDLKMSYFEYSLITATMILVQFLTLPRWGRVCDVFGNRVVLVFCGSIIPLTPILWLVSGQLWYLMMIQIIGGLAWAGFSLSSGNIIYELVPAKKRTTYLAMHNVLTGIAVFIGAMLGGFLGSVLPDSIHIANVHWQWPSVLCGVFILSGILRMTMAAIFLPTLRETRSVKPLTWQGLLTRVLRLRSRRRLFVTLARMRKKNLAIRSRV